MSLYQSGCIDRKEVVISEGDHIAVIGCGNTAIDAARTALRMGAASVKVIYHRTINEMSALRSEYEDAVAEGVEFIWKSSVTRIIGGPDDKLRSIFVSTDGSEPVEMPLDRLIMAVGSVPASRIVSTTAGIEVDDHGYVLTREEPYGMTTRRGVFAGGDVTNRPATVVHAMRDAKQVAESMIRYIDAKRLMEQLSRDEADMSRTNP